MIAGRSALTLGIFCWSPLSVQPCPSPSPAPPDSSGCWATLVLSSPVLLQGCCSSPLLFKFSVICSAQTSLHTEENPCHRSDIKAWPPYQRWRCGATKIFGNTLSVFHNPAPQLLVFYQTLSCPGIVIAFRNMCLLTAQTLIYLCKQLHSSCFKLNIRLKELNCTNTAKSYEKGGKELFTRACSEGTTSNDFEVKEGRFRLDLFSMRVVVIWARIFCCPFSLWVCFWGGTCCSLKQGLYKGCRKAAENTESTQKKGCNM